MQIPTSRHTLRSGILVACLILFLSYISASAHEVTPVKASPEPGQALQQSPAEVRLTFAEEIAESGSSLQVYDAQGIQVDKGKGGVDLNDPQHAMLVVALPELSQGVYQVKWSVTLLDGDISQGEYYFGIGNVTVPTALVEAAAPETTALQSTTAPQAARALPFAVWLAICSGLVILLAIGIYFLQKIRHSS
jgi:methionine-rich copper-binding protein CopC